MGQEMKAFTIAGDGTIKRTIDSPVTKETEYDQMCLTIIRVGSNYDSILGAYRARKKCYNIAKNFDNRFDYKEHVQQLQLDYFPNEFKKSLIGESYIKGIILAVISSIAICICLLWVSMYLFRSWFFTYWQYYYIVRSAIIGVTIVLLIIWLIHWTIKTKNEIRGIQGNKF